jgi:hypothetical protein
MNRRDDKTFLCVFDFPDQPEKGIFDKARDAFIRSLGSLSPRTNRVCEQGSLVDYRPYLHRRKTKSQVSANTVPLLSLVLTTTYSMESSFVTLGLFIIDEFTFMDEDGLPTGRYLAPQGSWLGLH